MRQVVQSARSGELKVVDVPRPEAGATEVLVAVACSVISSGTERSVRHVAAQSLAGKARARPDLARQVLQKARRDGIAPTARAVREKLEREMPLGYSSAGVLEEVGEAVAGLAPGMRVATAGAPHAAVQAVPGLLAAPVPDGVTDRDAALSAIAAVALHGLRLGAAGPGTRIGVVGLGLVGQLAMRIAAATGMEAVGVDTRADRVELASAYGHAFEEQGDGTTDAVLALTGGVGLDAVLVTAATPSADPVRRSAELCRDRASIVVVGDVGLDLQRAPLYERELTVAVARSYGPGRYDPTYERLGVDYPPGYVPFTARRNLSVYLGLVANGRLRVADLITHSFPIEEAGGAYELLDDDSSPALGIALTYQDRDRGPAALPARPRQSTGAEPSIGLIGAGTFARRTLLPALDAAGLRKRVAVASRSGRTASELAAAGGFLGACTAPELIADDGIDAVIVATPHDLHAQLTIEALRAGKHVLCEKPLALDDSELHDVLDAYRESRAVLAVGLNRRYSQAISSLRDALGGTGPLVIDYRVSAEQLPPEHWYRDRRQGGRLLGEVCHFVDTCHAIAGAPAEAVQAAAGTTDELLLAGDLVVTLRFGDGSLAAITYSDRGSPRAAKERIEVLGGGHSVVLEDFRRLQVDRGRVRSAGGGKGHQELLRAFARAVQTGEGAVEMAGHATETTAVTLAAARSLRTGSLETPEIPPLVQAQR